MCPRSLRISFHKPLRVDTRVLPLSRKGSGSMLHQVGLAFLPAVTPEPASAFLLQALLLPLAAPHLQCVLCRLYTSRDTPGWGRHLDTREKGDRLEMCANSSLKEASQAALWLQGGALV